MKTLNGDEPFIIQGKAHHSKVSDFWAWALSDMMDNSIRCMLAELIVATALGIDTSAEAREPWAPYDLLYNGIRVEVKASAYLQRWNAGKLSNIVFSIKPARLWSAETGYSATAQRNADVYVFCVHTCKERENSNPLDISQWEFYILPSSVLNDLFPSRKTITSNSLSQATTSVKYDALKQGIDLLGLDSL